MVLTNFQCQVSVTTNVLATVLANLYNQGYGISTEDPDDDNTDKVQDASGTGMGEGAGLNDVSEQITDEDQLLGANEKVCCIIRFPVCCFQSFIDF